MPILLVLNNGLYGTIRMHQERTYPGRVSGTTLENPDFVAIGKAYDFNADRVSETAQFAAAFGRGGEAGGGGVALPPGGASIAVKLDRSTARCPANRTTGSDTLNW